MEYLVNQAVKLPILSPGLATGYTTFTPLFLVNGTITSPGYTTSEIGSGLYTLNFTPAVVGKWSVFVGGVLQPGFEVTTKTIANVLTEIVDATTGSWQWNKSTGLLTLYKADSSTLATYQVTDTVESASRERLS